MTLTEIHQEKWDEELLQVLEFLHNREEWEGGDSVENMWKKVRFFQYHQYDLEPPAFDNRDLNYLAWKGDNENPFDIRIRVR